MIRGCNTRDSHVITYYSTNLAMLYLDMTERTGSLNLKNKHLE